MIFALFKNKNYELEKKKINTNLEIPISAFWLDIVKPDYHEELYLKKVLNIEAPTKKEMDKFEIISPFYTKKNIDYMTITIFDKYCKFYPNSTAVTFIVTQKYLISIRYENLRSFDYVDFWIIRNKHKYSIDKDKLLIIITEFIIDCLADILEEIGNKIDDLLKTVFKSRINGKKKTAEFNDTILNIGNTGTIISKNRESLVSLNRMMIYFSQISILKSKKRNFFLRFKHISREIYSLSEYANFLSQRNSFLLDATLGMISVEQNMIIKFFTIATAMFMPSTLITGIYGMNFKFMPEIDNVFGYPIILIIILFSSIIFYVYFKKRGWL